MTTPEPPTDPLEAARAVVANVLTALKKDHGAAATPEAIKAFATVRRLDPVADARVHQALRAAGLTRQLEERIMPEVARQASEVAEKANALETSPPGAPLILVIRDQNKGRDGALEFRGTPEQALRDALAADVSAFEFSIIELEVDAPIAFTDIDTHDWERPPTAAELEVYAKEVRPVPLVWWVTHGMGLRLAYVDATHEQAVARAALAALSIPNKAFTIELKSDSRHPSGAHPRRSGAACGKPVWSNEPPEPIEIERGECVPDRAAVERWLAEQGFEIGTYYEHSRCPIDPGHDSGGKPVKVYENQVFCFSCQARGKAIEGFAPGRYPFTIAVGGTQRASVIAEMATEWVHWEHAKRVLEYEHPNVGETVLRAAYRAALASCRIENETDERIGKVFNPDLKVARSHGVWVEARTFEPLKTTKDSFCTMPWFFRPVPTEEGVHLVPRGPRFDRAASGARLEGYIPVRAIRGILLRPECVDDREAVAILDPERGDPIRFLKGKELITEDEAFGMLSESFPGISHAYLKGLLAGSARAEAGGGRPPQIFAYGPSGSGKGETPRLAASILGDRLPKLRLETDHEKFNRALGSHAAAGRRFLLFDELGKVPKLGTHARFLLEISSEIPWRPLYANVDVLTPLRSMIVMTHISIPEAFAHSDELVRRVRTCHLPRRVPEWTESSGGETAEWRSRSPGNARIANSILTHSVRFAAEHGFIWDEIAGALGLARPNECGLHVDEQLYVDLYRHCRNEDGRRVLFTTGHFGDCRWVNLTSDGARGIFERLMSDEDENGAAVFRLKNRLEALDWNSILRIEAPSIACNVEHHRSQVALRFRNADERVLRGRETLNEQLPPDGCERRAPAPGTAEPGTAPDPPRNKPVAPGSSHVAPAEVGVTGGALAGNGLRPPEGPIQSVAPSCTPSREEEEREEEGGEGEGERGRGTAREVTPPPPPILLPPGERGLPENGSNGVVSPKKSSQVSAPQGASRCSRPDGGNGAQPGGNGTVIGAAPVVTIWSDGSCDNRPREAAGRVGGYAALVDTGSSRFEIFGAETEPTTSNRMELMAAIAALEFLTAPSTVKLHSDSQYLVNNACGPLAKWQANGWKNSLGEDVKNADLWRRLVAAMSKHVVDFQWVKGHVGQPLNERADELAGAARARALNGEAVPLTITEIANVPGDTPADTTGTTSVSSLIDAPPTVAGVITNASVGEIPAGSVATDDAVGRANGATDLLDFLRGQPAAETGGEGATP